MNIESPSVRFLFPAIRFLIAFVFTTSLYSQPIDPDRENGALFTRYYPPKEYKAFSQNWGALQNARGVMVFANGDGILKYDGVTWEFHSLPNLVVVRSLAMDGKGRVFVGAYDELGYLDTDSLGNYKYVSLLPHLTEEQKQFGNIHNTYAVNDSVIFRTEKGLYIWHNEQFSQINWPNQGYRMLFLVEEIFYVHLDSVGLCVLKNNQLEMLKNGEFFIGKKVLEILPYNEIYKLIFTAYHGLFLYNENEIIPFKTEVDELLMRNITYCGISLPSGDYAIGTFTGGVFIINKNGKIKSILNKLTGLGDNTVYSLCLDHQGALWAMLSNGICRVEVQSPISHFWDNSGLEGSVTAITRLRGTLFVGTSQGFYKLNSAKLPDISAHFERVDGFNAGVWGMVNTGEALIINSEVGSFVFEYDRFRKIHNHPGYSIVQGKSDREIIFCGLGKGMSIIKKVDGQWIDHGRISGIQAETSEIREEENGNIWVSTYSEGVFLLKFPIKNSEPDYLNPMVKNYGKTDGLDIGFTRIFLIGGQLLFHVKRNEKPDQLYRFDPDTETFLEYNDFADDIDLKNMAVFPITQEENGRFWAREIDNSTNRMIVERESDGTFNSRSISFSRLLGYNFRNVYEEDNIAWWGGHDGLVKIDISKFEAAEAKPFYLLINKISLSDSVLFVGTNEPLQFLKFPYELNSIRFEYAAASYDVPQENQYQYWLEGFDKDWSDWTKETIKSYTRIPEGSYTFKVRGKNIYGDLSEVDTFSFSITPPWFRSWWAYLLYFAVGITLFTGTVQWRLGRVKREKENLEQIVVERTKEMKRQAEQLERQADKLKELDVAKSHFFANISHEFRTPLTIILGLVEENLSTGLSVEDANKHSIMLRSAKRLQNLIDQLLDLSKLEAKELKLSVQQGDIYWFLRSIASGFSSFAIQRNIEYQIRIPEVGQVAFFDIDKLEKMVSNLLTNAFKFTRAKGRVTISANVENDMIIITVEDTGMGIPSNQVEKIFDRFYQIDNGLNRLQEGAGIGLALTKELAELHHGNIKVESQIDHGSIFRIILPINRSAYAQNEINPALTKVGDLLGYTEPRLEEDDTDISMALVRSEDLPILLVVEDNRDLRQFIAGQLKKYKIIEAANGVEGFNKALKFIPDLIISDIMMPEMDGVELCKKIKADEKTSHIPVILLTAKADIESRLEGLKTGADDYLTKPYHARELSIRIKNLIFQREKLKERFSRSVILKPQDIALTSPDVIFLQKVMAIVENHIGDSEFSTEDFQQEIGMSRMQLHRKLKALTGHSAGDFMRVQRLIRASDMLSKGAGNISEICYRTGFTSLSYFSKCFKKQYGSTPKEYASSS